VELGVTDFKAELSPAQTAALLVVDHLHAHGVEMSAICSLMRWLGLRLPLADMAAKPPPVLTLLDYRYAVVSFDRAAGFDLTAGEIPLSIVATRHCAVSTAFVLPVVLRRKLDAIEALRSTARISRPSQDPAAAT
jgi:hypothetical protein